MQKIFPSFFKRVIAKATPHDIATGKAGGTVTVSKSSVRSNNTLPGTLSLSYIGKVRKLPTIAAAAMIPTNFIPSE